jgi:hypothetical protein
MLDFYKKAISLLKAMQACVAAQLVTPINRRDRRY